MKKIITAPHIYTMEGEGVGYRENYAILIENSKILDIGLREEILAKHKGVKVHDYSNHMILPGFIDAHMHTAMAVLRGLAQDTNYWMMYGLQPFSNAAKKKDGELGSKLGILEGVMAGTTTFGDYENDMDSVCKFVEKLGVRATITTMIREAERRVYDPGELYEFSEKQGLKEFEKNVNLFDKWHNAAEGRIRVFFGPQGADFLSKELLLKIKEEAIKRDTKIHMHVQQGDRETYQIEKRYGKRPIEWLEEIGMLDERLIAVHLTDATEEEAKKVARSGASMIVCPGSIGIIDGIVCPSVAFQEAGGSVGLGSDQAPGNNCHNIINEMKLVTLFNKIKYQDPEVMPCWKALRMATIEGAKAIGWDDEIGSLEIGKKADLIAIDLKALSMQPIYTYPMRNLIPNLVYSARGNEVSMSMVNGEIIYENYKFTNYKVKKLLEKLEKRPLIIGENAAEEFYKINGTNAKYMENGFL